MCAEQQRNLKKFEKRSSKNRALCSTFECVYPVDKQEILNNPVLLTGISGDTEMFFKMYLCASHSYEDQKCPSNCICFSATRSKANVLHFAAAYGNADFISTLLFPEESMLVDRSLSDHYKIMLERWLNSAISANGSFMFPFDVAVYYSMLTLLSYFSVCLLR
ncbi:hypothetical protein DICVIV_05950 [Dictyocaulus viviparus]|uniref:Ankyrin repeat protein n=1 Tax=Dictyocaulus viviparus TaxID=29172 RepID=A0A0D8XW14_DICVI|nr:hypothetical protein DICVIV_05950 [Dictyocaulus viviparus]